jgi:50S ribosomal subunit-associated GTPase HflX
MNIASTVDGHVEVGLRGPGESQFEIDKRLGRDRILILEIDDAQKL